MKLGDDVRVSTRGPVMMVVDIDGYLITVAWRDKIGDVYEAEYPAFCLEQVKPLSA